MAEEDKDAVAVISWVSTRALVSGPTSIELQPLSPYIEAKKNWPG